MSLLLFSCLSLYTWVAFKVQNTLFEFLCAWSWFEGEIQSRRSSSISSIRISQLRTSELLGGRAKWINNLSLDLNFVVAEKKEIAYRNLDRMLSWAELCPERNWRAGKLASQNEGFKCLALHWASNRTEFVHYIERTAAKKRVLNTRNWTEERHLPIIN